MVWPCCAESLRARACTCRVGIWRVEPTVTPLWEKLALLVAPASCSGRSTEGANSQPNESELLGCTASTRVSPPPPAGTGAWPADTPDLQFTAVASTAVGAPQLSLQLNPMTVHTRQHGEGGSSYRQVAQSPVNSAAHSQTAWLWLCACSV